ncbi:MAG: glycosyltransferase family 39 protein, partial [Putridiphycobacter sp.]|nr:glycosyltransferase family 39 protein [Putridiphycobacter sp.]
MRFWDESMFAVNTYEMMKNGQYFALFFDGKPDLFNTKPPLTSWLQLLSVKALGYNEMAIRLPSALASIISVFALFQFLFKNFSAQLAWISILILVTTQGYVGFHTSRTGDSDALLSCFLLLGNLQILNYLLHQKKQSILYFFMFLTLAALAKLFAGILFLPSILVILLWQKKLKAVVLTWQFLFGLIGFLAIATSVLLLREAANPGYLTIAFGKDAGRVFDVIEGHQESALYYVDLLFNAQFSIYMLFTIIGLFATAWFKGPLK